jgi:RNA polymerase sigma-70 factor, ECF subfamily
MRQAIKHPLGRNRRPRRNAPQMVEIKTEDGIADNIVEPSKDSHDLYVSKQEAEHVRAAIQKLPVDFREIILLREYEELSIWRLQMSWTVLLEQ